MKSTAGVGSTFGFFVKTRRAEPPPPASRGSVASTEALTDVRNLPHSEGKQDVKILTMSNAVEESSLSVNDLHVLVCEDNKINQKVQTTPVHDSLRANIHSAGDCPTA